MTFNSRMLAGIYGMNFEWMPELRWHYAYVACLGLMAIIAVVEVWIFYRCGWFD